MKRTDNRDLAASLLDHCMFVNLAVTLPDGSPYCVPLSPVRVGQELYFHCGRKGRKVDALRRNPNICLTCVGKVQVIPGAFDTEYQSVMAFGSACEITDEAEKVYALRLICQRYCPDDLGDFQQVLDKYLPATGIWKITLDEVTTKG